MRLVRSKNKVSEDEKFVQEIENAAVKNGGVVFDPAKGNLHINEDYLELPVDISTLPSKELGDTLNAFTQQKLYLRTAIMRQEVTTEYSKRVFYKHSQTLFEEMSRKRMSEAAKERLLSSNDETRECYEDWNNKSYILKYMETMLLNIEDSIFLLSREISRRSSDYTDENRLHNIQNRKY